MTNLDPAIRERHHPLYEPITDINVCAADGQVWGLWGCDTAQVLAALDECVDASNALRMRLNRAALDVDRLAKAICASRPPEPETGSDLFVDDECRGLALRVIAALSDTGVGSTHGE